MWSFIDKDKRTFYWTFVEFCVLLQEKMCVFICILKKKWIKSKNSIFYYILKLKNFSSKNKQAKAKE